jgi:hypothetical protein
MSLFDYDFDSIATTPRKRSNAVLPSYLLPMHRVYHTQQLQQEEQHQEEEDVVEEEEENTDVDISVATDISTPTVIVTTTSVESSLSPLSTPPLSPCSSPPISPSSSPPKSPTIFRVSDKRVTALIKKKRIQTTTQDVTTTPVKKKYQSTFENSSNTVVEEHDEERFQRQREISRMKHKSKEVVKQMNEMILTRQSLSQKMIQGADLFVTHPMISTMYQILVELAPPHDPNTSLNTITRKHPSYMSLLDCLNLIFKSYLKKRILGKRKVALVFDNSGDPEMKRLIKRYRENKILQKKTQVKQSGTGVFIEFLLDQHAFSVFVLKLFKKDCKDNVSQYLASYYDTKQSILVQPAYISDLTLIMEHIGKVCSCYFTLYALVY